MLLIIFSKIHCETIKRQLKQSNNYYTNNFDIPHTARSKYTCTCATFIL